MRVVVAVLVVMGLGACAEPSAPPTVVPQALTERQALNAPPAQRLALGGDCGPYGSAGCASGLCLKTGANLGRVGHVCSKQCNTSNDCGPGMACTQVHPAEGGMLCVPTGSVVDGGSP